MVDSVGVSSAFSWPPLPVDPTSVTELKLEGDEGPLIPGTDSQGVSLSGQIEDVIYTNHR